MPDVYFATASGLPGYAQAAARDAGTAFIDGGRQSSTSRQRAPDDPFLIDSDTDYALAPGRIAGLGLSSRRPIGRDLEIGLRTTLERRDQDARLPKGIGILTDPMRISLSGESAAIELSLAQRHGDPQGTMGTTWLSLGYSRTNAEIAFNSALISLKDSGTYSASWLGVGASLGNADGPQLTGEARIYREGSTEYRLGVDFPF